MSESLIKYFRLLFDQIPFSVEVINEEGKIVFVNQAFTFQWGYNLSELTEYSIFNDSELKNSGVHALILKTFEKKNYTFFENYSDSLLKSKEMTIPILRTKIFHVSFEGKEYVVLFHEDQTEMVLAEEEVKKSRDASKESERLKNTFLNVLSHELRTPLNIILGYSSILKESLEDKLTPEDKVYLDNLYTGSERLFKTITQMLEFAQIEAGNYKVNIETIELNSLIKNAIESIRSIAADKNLDLKVNFREKLIYVDVDIQCAESAINNLLNNAVKFTRQGFIEVEVNLLEERELAVCKIKDSGVGISSEYLDHLFHPFSQEDLNIGRNYEGNGLGLALAKRYIEKMGGSLLVDSIKGVGSTFTFTLPLSVSNNEKKTETEVNDSFNKIFMIDDSSETYDLLNAFLKNNYVIDSCSFQDFNFDLVKGEKKYRAIILDVNQNRWDQNIKICKELKNNDPHKRPLIVISSEFIDNKIKEFYEAGANKFLVKPFSKKELVNALEDVIKN
ncbi:MAG: ATP-binding protein [Ignavibacteriaceae bacterium]